MGGYVADQVLKLMTQKCIHLVDARILILGLTFKESCPEVLNTRVDLIEDFKSFNCNIDVYDSRVDKAEMQYEYNINLVEAPITGAAGFIDLNILEKLLKLNQEVVGLDNFEMGHQHVIDQAI